MAVQQFDLSRYTRASKKLDLTGIDFDRVSDYPVSPAEIKALTYMMDIETHTVIYLRDLLGTPAAQDPEITAFLSMWVYEEYWHGEALGAFLRAAGVDILQSRPSENRPPFGVRDALGTVAKSLVARALPEFIAVHMTWGAINELSTLNGYQRVIAQTRNPILAELLTRIIKDERRHYAFYYGQARRRLEQSERAQKMTRMILDKFWQPVGTGVRPQHETDFVAASLFDSVEGRAAMHEMEKEIGKLPGLHGFRLITRALNRAAGRAPATAAPSSRMLGFPVAASMG